MVGMLNSAEKSVETLTYACDGLDPEQCQKLKGESTPTKTSKAFGALCTSVSQPRSRYRPKVCLLIKIDRPMQPGDQMTKA